VTDASVTHLLRTTLSKNATDATLNPAPLGIPTDTEKLKKHIALVCDRLGKGAKLTEGLHHTVLFAFHFAPGGVGIIAMSTSVCLSVHLHD